MNEFDGIGVEALVWVSAIDSVPDYVFKGIRTVSKERDPLWRSKLGLVTLDGEHKPHMQVWLNWLQFPKE